MNYKSKWITFAVKVKNHDWKTAINFSANFFQQVNSSKNITLSYFDLNYTEELVIINLKTKYYKTAFFRLFYRKVKNLAKEYISNPLFKNYLTFVKVSYKNKENSLIFSASNHSFKDFLGKPLSNLLIKRLEAKNFLLENFLIATIYAHLGWIRSINRIYKMDLLSILVLGYGGYKWIKYYDGDERITKLKKLYEENTVLLSKAVHDVFINGTGKSCKPELREWLAICENYLLNEKSKKNNVLKEINSYYFPQFINQHLGKNESLKILSFYVVARIIQEYSFSDNT